MYVRRLFRSRIATMSASSLIVLLVYTSLTTFAQQTGGLPECSHQRPDPNAKAVPATCGTGYDCKVPQCIDFVHPSDNTLYRPCTKKSAALGSNCVTAGQVNCGLRGTCWLDFNQTTRKYFCNILAEYPFQGPAPVDGGACFTGTGGG